MDHIHIHHIKPNVQETIQLYGKDCSDLSLRIKHIRLAFFITRDKSNNEGKN